LKKSDKIQFILNFELIVDQERNGHKKSPNSLHRPGCIIKKTFLITLAQGIPLKILKRCKNTP